MNKRAAGVTCAEVVVAFALFFILSAPVFPALAQIRANHAYAPERHRAQALAMALVAAERSEGWTARYTAEGFTYRVRAYAEGDGGDVSFSSTGHFGGGTLYVAEVFDKNGRRAGLCAGIEP
jgi:hypothetical protein